MRFLIGFILAITWPGMLVMGGYCPASGPMTGEVVLCVGSGNSCVNLLDSGGCCAKRLRCAEESDPDAPCPSPMSPEDCGLPCIVICCEVWPSLGGLIGPLKTGDWPIGLDDVLPAPTLLPIEAWAAQPPGLTAALSSDLDEWPPAPSARRATLCVWLN